MNKKTVLLVIIISILIGVGIFFFSKPTEKKVTTSPSLLKQISSSLNNPKETPVEEPTPPPLDDKTNLSDEMKKLTIPDFSQDYKNLKDEVNQL